MIDHADRRWPVVVRLGDHKALVRRRDTVLGTYRPPSSSWCRPRTPARCGS